TLYVPDRSATRKLARNGVVGSYDHCSGSLPKLPRTGLLGRFAGSVCAEKMAALLLSRKPAGDSIAARWHREEIPCSTAAVFLLALQRARQARPALAGSFLQAFVCPLLSLPGSLC